MAYWKTIALQLAIAIGALVPAAAQQVGTATAVNPLSESTPPGGATQTITIGARVVHKERIHTSPSGSVQLRFLDKSSLSIAPNTSIVIDEFIYDPNANQGHMLATITQGALRYVGGELSHQGEVEIKSPNATIGIRGGTTTITQGPGGTTAVNHFGTLTITNGATGQTGPIILTHNGMEITITGWNVPPGQPVQVTAAEIEHYIKILTSKSGQHGSGQLSNLNGFECGAPATQPCPQQPWMPTTTGQDDSLQIIIQGTQRGTQIMPPPPPPPTSHP